MEEVFYLLDWLVEMFLNAHRYIKPIRVNIYSSADSAADDTNRIIRLHVQHKTLKKMDGSAHKIIQILFSVQFLLLPIISESF